MIAEGNETHRGGGAAGEPLAVARLHRPHGLGGEVRAEPLAPAVLDFEELILGREFILRRAGAAPRRVRVEGARPHQNGFLLALEGFEDRTAAEALNGAELCLPRAELPALPEGWHWEADIVGSEVVDARRGRLGLARGLADVAGRWSLAVEIPGPPAREILIPWRGGLVKKVSPGEKQISVDLPLEYPGLDD